MDEGLLVQMEHHQRFLWWAAGGATTSAGNVGGTTLIDTARTEVNDFWNEKYDIVLLDGANKHEVRQIVDFDAGTDTITVSPAFTAQVASGVPYVIRKMPSSLQGADNADNLAETSNVVGNIDGSQVERMESVIKAIQIVAAAGTGFEEDGSGATLYNTLISVEGATDGAGTTATIVDSARTEGADYWNGTTIVMLAGSAAGQTRTIVDDDGAGTLTVEPVLGAASGTGNAYVILNQKGTDWIIGDNNANNAYDSSTVTANDDGSVLERLEFLQTVTVVGEGTFTTSSATVPADTSQGAKADDWFSGCILLPTAGSVAYQPRLIVDFTTTTGVFTIDSEHPFTAATGTETYVVLSNEADLVPAADSTATTTTAHVVGNKADTIPAMNTPPSSNDSLVRHAKAILERIGATPNDPDDSVLTVLGQRDDAATNDDMSDITTTSTEAKLRLILNRLSDDAFTTTIQGSARTALDTMLGQLATYFAASGAAWSVQLNNQTARTNLEQVLEDFFTAIGIDGTNVWTNVSNAAATTLDAQLQALYTVIGCDGANTFAPVIDGSARTTVETAFEAIAGMITEIGGLSRFGTVSAATDTQNFKIAELSGYGDDFFNTDWVCVCLHNADNDGNAPEGEIVDVTDYTSSDGSFVTAAFTVAPTVGDEMVVAHRVFFTTDGVALQTTPATNSLAYRLSQFLASGDGDWAGSTALPSNKSLYDIIGASYVDGGGGFNLESIRDDLRTLAQYLIDGTAGAEAGTVLPAGKSVRDIIGTSYVDGGGAWNAVSIADDLNRLGQVLIDGTAGNEAGTNLAAGKSIIDAIGHDGTTDNDTGLMAQIEDYLETGFNSSAITENTDGSVMEMIKAIINNMDLKDLSILADQDIFDVADADANNERWDAGYLNGAEGGSADISTTTAGKLMVKVDPDATPTAAMYAVYNSQAVTSKYATWIVDLDATISGTLGSQQSTGMEISEATYSTNDRVYIQKQNGATGERITAGAIFNGANQGEQHYSTADDAIALKIERRDNVWRTYYSLTQSPDYAWVMLAEYEDTNEDIAAETECYLEAYSPGGNDDQVSQGDFDNWKLYVGFKGLEQILAGDFDSAFISRNDDGSILERLESIIEDMRGTNGIATWPAAADIGNGVSLAEGLRAVLTSIVGGDDYDAWTNINNTANTSLNAALQNLAAVLGADGANVFNPTMQGSARTSVDAAFESMADYISPSGAAFSTNLNGSARTSVEETLEDMGNILSGTTGIVTFPAAAAAGNGVSMAEVIRYISDTQMSTTRAGVAQIKTTTIDLNQAAATYDLFTGSSQDVLIESLVIRLPNVDVSDDANITSISIQTDDATVTTFISSVAGAKANLTAESQHAWPGSGEGPIFLEVGSKIQLTIAGGAADAATVCDVAVKCRANADGGTLT